MQNEIKDTLKKHIQYVKGVGEARAKLFQNLNIFTIEELITHFPREYEDRRHLKKIFQLEDGESCSFEGIIASSVIESRIRQNLSVFKLFIEDETATIMAFWFNQDYIKKVFKPGDTYIFFGKISRKTKSFEVQNPVYEKVTSKEISAETSTELKNSCRIIPIYPATERLTQNVIRSVIEHSLKLVIGNLEEVLSEEVRNRYTLSEVNDAMHNIHFPKSFEDFLNARRRLVF